MVSVYPAALPDVVEAGGKTFPVRLALSGNRTASARLREGAIIITLPSRWPRAEKERVAVNLLRRAIRAIESGKWSERQAAKVEFGHGQRIVAMGHALELAFLPAKRFASRIREGRLEIKVVDGHPRKAEIASRLARKRIIEECMPLLLARVKRLNDEHFRAIVPKVRLRDNTSRWGSCSRDGSICISFRLLFMPEEVLDYVIIHELAHTRYRSHGPRFWALVERAMPEHRERRRWLRDNGWSYPKAGEDACDNSQQSGQNENDCFICEEPY